MSLKLRLARAGTKKRPYYHIVVADARSPRDGRFIERIGTYDPVLADVSKLLGSGPGASRFPSLPGLGGGFVPRKK